MYKGAKRSDSRRFDEDGANDAMKKDVKTAVVQSSFSPGSIDAMIWQRIGPQWVPIVAQKLWEMRLFIFVREGLASKVCWSSPLPAIPTLVTY